MKFEKFGEILSIHKGKKNTIIESPSSDSVRVLQIDDLRNDNLYQYTDDKTGVFVTEKDLMIVWDGANAGTIGYGKQGYIGSTIAALRRKNELYDTSFLGLFLKSQFSYFQKNATGATIPHIDRKSLENLMIPHLSIETQIHIANILSKAERLIQQRKETIALLDDYLKSTFLEMFGDPIRNEKGWEKIPLKKFGEIITGNTPPRSDSDNFSDNYIEWIKTDNIENNILYVKTANEYLSQKGLNKSRFVTEGALMVACIAGSIESIGRACLTNRKVAFNQQINAIQPNENINSFFLHNLFKNSRLYIQSHTTKGMKKILTKGEFEKILMIAPPIELQNQFAQIVEKVEVLKEQYKSSLLELENLYGSLSAKAFRGEMIAEEKFGDNKIFDKMTEIISTSHNKESVNEEDMINQFEDVQLSYDYIEKYNYVENKEIQWEIFLRKYFLDKPIILEEVEELFNSKYYDESDRWFKYEKFKDYIFHELQKKNSFIKQKFNDSTRQLELLISNEIN